MADKESNINPENNVDNENIGRADEPFNLEEGSNLRVTNNQSDYKQSSMSYEHNIHNSRNQFSPDEIDYSPSNTFRKNHLNYRGRNIKKNNNPRSKGIDTNSGLRINKSHHDSPLKRRLFNNPSNNNTIDDGNKNLSNPLNTPGKEAIDDASKIAKAATKLAGKAILAVITNPVFILVSGIVTFLCLILLVFIIMINGGDIDTGNSDAYSCSSTTTTTFDMTKTSLSREQFIDKVKAYTPSRGEKKSDNERIDAAYEVFKANAGLIYDMGVERGYNPEFVIIRADTEGFSPGYDTYNYWGIGCENGHPEKCVNKDDFASGLSRFFDVFDNYKKPKEEGGKFGIDVSNIYEVMNLYADLGTTWISPGNSSDGGCYYLSYIKPYLSQERYDVVKASCDAKTNIKVTDEDELAYAKYQVETETIPKRNKIFGVGAEEVRVCSLKEVNVNPVLTPDTATILSSTNVNTFLRANGTSVTAFNNTLLETVKKDGIGTRQAVVDAAMLFVNTFATYNMKIPYSYYGGWSSYDTNNPNDHNYRVTSYYGINPYFGENIVINGRLGYYNAHYNKYYYYLGLDCSGFVTWSLHNGGVIHRLDRAKCYKINANERQGEYESCGSDGGTVKAYPADSKKYIGQPGDVLSSDSHVMLVLKYNSEHDSYIFAEAGGKEKGILIRERKLSNLSNYKIVNMDDYYSGNFTNKNYEKDFQEKRLDKTTLNQAR